MYREKEGQTHRYSVLVVALSPPQWSNGIASHWSGKQVYQRLNINSLVFWELSEEGFCWPPFLGFRIHSPLCNKNCIWSSVFTIFMHPVFLYLLSTHKTGHEEKLTDHLVPLCHPPLSGATMLGLASSGHRKPRGELSAVQVKKQRKGVNIQTWGKMTFDAACYSANLPSWLFPLLFHQLVFVTQLNQAGQGKNSTLNSRWVNFIFSKVFLIGGTGTESQAFIS